MKRYKEIKIYLQDDEYDMLKRKAADARMSMGRYLWYRASMYDVYIQDTPTEEYEEVWEDEDSY